MLTVPIYLFVVGIRMILYITYHTYMHACLMIAIAAAKAPKITDGSGFLLSSLVSLYRLSYFISFIV